VVSVDGLDVIDGENGDLRKRGYVVPPHGDVKIEGFRTSTADVATFRFSSVDGSYAGKKGKARNVGVIAVAIFEEEHAADPQIIVGGGGDTYGGGRYRRPYDYTDDLDDRAPTAGYDKRPAPPRVSRTETVKSNRAAKRRMPATEPTPRPDSVASRPSGGGAAGAPARPYHVDNYRDMDEEMPPPVEQQHRTHRPGLGTEFGETRTSAATYTRFVRAASRPIAIAELRYNNAAGLVALGINAQPLPDAGEIMTRETADPFPGDHHYATRPD
jgi:hypothetical protein